MSAFAPLAELPLADIPGDLSEASATTGRARLVAGLQPRPAVVLVDFLVQPVSEPPRAWMTETQAILDAMPTQPDDWVIEAYNVAVADLIGYGLWPEIGALFWMAGHTEAASLINWRDPSSTPATNSGATWTQYRGFTGNGSSAYVDTGLAWNAIPGVAQDDAHIAAHAVMSSNNGQSVAGVVGSANVMLGRSGGNFSTRLHTATATSADALSAAGAPAYFMAASRAASGSYERYINAAAVTGASQTSSAPPSGNLTFLRSNTTYSPALHVIRFGCAGAALTATQMGLLRGIVHSLATKLGAT